MKEFLSPEAAKLSPYTPGEQPLDKKYVKLNTNESPFPPSPKVLDALSREESEKLNLYPDPACRVLTDAIAKRHGVKPENVIAGNGSDEILAFAFRAFCGSGIGAAYADITYSFYKAQTALFGLDATVIPLRDDFSLCVDDYLNFPGTVFIANPNAPTGMEISVKDISRLAKSNPERVVVIDEAYVDFGGETCVPLTARYDNLLVVQTFSKSRSLAGGRVGFAIGAAGLIAALNRVKYSFNPYNVNRLSLVAGAAAMEDEAYFQACCEAIQANRAWTADALKKIGFTVLPSKANFVFAKSDRLSGEEAYRGLKERGVLVRWFDAPRLKDYLRISIGSRDQMQVLIDRLKEMSEGT
ncbi:MAG: histidinol-phosphate transaminase [Oscillibacter sp.]|nr:histidinol-phosphate transaminase [Oscillibacter sp.]